MKNITLLLLVVLSLLIGGCSQTWKGVKEDSSSAWNSTKGAIHRATE